MKMPFMKNRGAKAQRAIKLADSNGRRIGIPTTFDMWVNRLSIQSKTPVLEGIYNTVADELSKIDLFLIKESDGYAHLRERPEYGILAERPNSFQTKADLLYVAAYQLYAYRNALIHIVRDEGVVTALEPLNCEDYLFGQGYQVEERLYLKLKEIRTNEIILIDYNDLLHLRLNPNDIFYGDKNGALDLTHFVRLFDENLNVMLNELKNAGVIRGIVEVGPSMGAGSLGATFVSSENKISKQKEIMERIRASEGGVLVLDSGETWKPLTGNVRTMTTDEVNQIMLYLHNFMGINQAVINGTATQAQMEIFFNKTIMPIVERLVSELNYKFLTADERASGLRIDYFKNPFEYVATKDIFSGSYLSGMYLTQNEVRRLAFKLPSIDGGDALMDNKNFEKLSLTKGGD